MSKFSGSVIVSDFGYSYCIYRACELVSVINRTESLSFGDLRDNTVCFRIDIFSFTFSIIKLQKKTLDVAFDILRVYKVYNCPPGSHYPHSYISFLPWHSLHLQVFAYHKKITIVLKTSCTQRWKSLRTEEGWAGVMNKSIPTSMRALGSKRCRTIFLYRRYHQLFHYQPREPGLL